MRTPSASELSKLFEQIQAIPYRIQLSPAEPDCSCSGKAKKLKEELEKRNVPVRYRVVEFRWSDLSLPQTLLAIPHDLVCTHVYLEVQRGNQWSSVDPTWEPALKNILPIAQWDGIHDTILAVHPIKKYDLKKSARIMEENTDADILADLKKNGAFYRAFNDWLTKNRVLEK